MLLLIGHILNQIGCIHILHITIFCYRKNGEPEQIKACNLAMFPAQHSDRDHIKGIIWQHLEKHQIQLEKVLLCLTTAVVTPNEFNILLVTVEQRGQEDQWQQRIAWLNYQGLLLENGTCHLPPHTTIPISPLTQKAIKSDCCWRPCVWLWILHPCVR